MKCLFCVANWVAGYLFVGIMSLNSLMGGIKMNLKNNTLVAVITSSLLALGGCSSTSNTNKQPELTVKDTAPIEWNNDESVALNIVKMGYRDGKGKGVSDGPVDTDMTVEHDDPNALFSFYSGFYQGGLVLGLGALLMDSEIENMTKWYPFGVDFISKESVNIENRQLAYKQVSSVLESKVRAAFSSIDGADYYGMYGNTSAASVQNFLFSGEYCNNAFYFGDKKEREGVTSNEVWKRYLVGVTNDLMSRSDVCHFSVTPKIVGQINDNYVVVYSMGTQSSALYFLLNGGEELGFFAVIPDAARVQSIDNPKDSEWVTIGQVYVVKGGKQYLFDEDETSAFESIIN